MKLYKHIGLLILGFLLAPVALMAQDEDVQSADLSLDDCIEYALKNRPLVEQSRIDEAIGEREINAQLSSWLPQVSAQLNATHNFRLQTAAFGENLVTIGRKNTSNLLLQANQTLYNNDVFLASRAARYRRLQLDQNTVEAKVNTVVEVSKAFYDILFTLEQLRILDENIARLEKQYRDAVSRYETGKVSIGINFLALFLVYLLERLREKYCEEGAANSVRNAQPWSFTQFLPLGLIL